MTQWTLYTRPGCSLCEAMAEELAQVLVGGGGAEAASRVQVVDITDDDELERRYGSRIPVLLADGDFVCCYRLDRDRVSAYLG